MRCETITKWLSDDLDGALSPNRKARLEAHLRECRACLGTRSDLILLQAEALPVADRSPEYWAAFEKRLESKLA
ncbi:MAG: zf-HC2 domain-containing protein, partial [Candidatus Aminicenantes bacterium]